MKKHLIRRAAKVVGIGKQFSVITALIAFLFVAHTDAQVQTSLDVGQALGLVRTLNTIQSVIATNTKAYGSEAEMLIGKMGLRTHLKAYSIDKDAPEWVKQVNFSSSEILPGWALDFALVGKGYRLILTSKDDALITDETGVIYRAVAALSTPKAAQLKSAKDFPGAVSHEQFQKKEKLPNS
jgi:hypothetical protein